MTSPLATLPGTVNILCSVGATQVTELTLLWCSADDFDKDLGGIIAVQLFVCSQTSMIAGTFVRLFIASHLNRYCDVKKVTLKV